MQHTAMSTKRIGFVTSSDLMPSNKPSDPAWWNLLLPPGITLLNGHQRENIVVANPPNCTTTQRHDDR